MKVLILSCATGEGHNSAAKAPLLMDALFFHYHGMSYSSLDIHEQASVAIRLCEDAAYRADMMAAQQRGMNAHTGQDLLALLES